MIENYRKRKQEEAAADRAERVAATIDYNVLLGNLEDPEMPEEVTRDE